MGKILYKVSYDCYYDAHDRKILGVKDDIIENDCRIYVPFYLNFDSKSYRGSYKMIGTAGFRFFDIGFRYDSWEKFYIFINDECFTVYIMDVAEDYIYASVNQFCTRIGLTDLDKIYGLASYDISDTVLNFGFKRFKYDLVIEGVGKKLGSFYVMIQGIIGVVFDDDFNAIALTVLSGIQECQLIISNVLWAKSTQFIKALVLLSSA